MNRFLLTLILGCLCLGGFAQTQTGVAKPSKPAEEPGMMSWVQDAWKTVQTQGKPAAERIVRQFPKRFKTVKQQVADLSKTVHDRIAAMDLEQKKNLAVERWKVRKSLDLMTLLQPEVLQSLTGLDPNDLSSLERQAQRLTALVQAQISVRK